MTSGRQGVAEPLTDEMRAVLRIPPLNDTGVGAKGAQTGPQAGEWAFANHYYLVLTCPDGRELRLGYDEASAYEIAQSFSHTKVKAKVVKTQHRFKKEVTQ